MVDEIASGQSTPLDMHRAAFAQVLADVDGLQLIPRAEYNLGRVVPRGYIFAIQEAGLASIQPVAASSSDGPASNVYISWSGSTRLAEVMRRMQVSNPHELTVLAVLRRDNVHDARTITEYITNGLTLQRVRGSWFAVDAKKIARMFANIDVLPVPGAEDGR